MTIITIITFVIITIIIRMRGTIVEILLMFTCPSQPSPASPQGLQSSSEQPASIVVGHDTTFDDAIFIVISSKILMITPPWTTSLSPSSLGKPSREKSAVFFYIVQRLGDICPCDICPCDICPCDFMPMQHIATATFTHRRHSFYQISVFSGQIPIGDIYQISDRSCITSDRSYG